MRKDLILNLIDAAERKKSNNETFEEGEEHGYCPMPLFAQEFAEKETVSGDFSDASPLSSAFPAISNNNEKLFENNETKKR